MYVEGIDYDIPPKHRKRKGKRKLRNLIISMSMKEY